MTDDIHREEPIQRAGASLPDAEGAVLMLHGRGARAGSVLAFAEEFDVPGLAYLAPQAARNTWYPKSFMAPTEQNEPWLSAAIERVDEVLGEVTGEGPPLERTALLGFSQGACLASEYVARNADRYGGLVCYSGGLIGPEGTPREYDRTLDGTPVLVGCSDEDPHIPIDRVHETTEVLEGMGADVDERIYPGMGHTVNEDEVAATRELLDGMVE